jgi:hypothetical protein
MIARSTLFLAGGVGVLVVLSGCGFSTPKPDPAREARLVAETNAVCRSIVHRAHPAQTQQLETQHRLAVLVKALGQAAAYLPAGRWLNEARAKRRVLYAEVQRLSGSGRLAPEGPEVFERFYRLRVQIYEADKALGLTACMGRPPRPPISG